MWRLWSWDAMVPPPSLANKSIGGDSNLNNLHDDYYLFFHHYLLHYFLYYRPIIILHTCYLLIMVDRENNIAQGEYTNLTNPEGPHNNKSTLSCAYKNLTLYFSLALNIHMTLIHANMM